MVLTMLSNSAAHSPREVLHLLLKDCEPTSREGCLLFLPCDACSYGCGLGWLRGSVVKGRSLAGVLLLSCAQPAADG